jgi:ABC-type Zn uptake system ZnuABC Zn-binding protein ZnuA
MTSSVRYAGAGAVAIALIALIVVLAVACSGGSSSDGPKVKVVTTLPVLADFAREVGGDRVEVTSLIPPGINPDDWEPAPGDAERVAAADIVFANSRNTEPEAIQFIRQNIQQGVRFAEMAALYEKLEHVGGAEVFHETLTGGHQPVLWMSPQNGKAYAKVIGVELADIDPDGAGEYERNGEEYFERLAETERYAFNVLDSVPPENKKMITPDTSLEYFGNYYAVEHTEQVSRLDGEEIDSEDLERIKQSIVERDARAVFVQPYSSAESDLLRRAAEETGVQVCTLYSDSLDDRVRNFLDVMRFNADELYRCLGGQSGG